MKRGSRKANNGYIGIDQSTIPTTGVVTPNKTYGIQVRELPYYQFGNTANAFGVAGSNYQRPTEWLSLPSVTAGSQQLVGLYAVYNNESNVCSMQIQGAYNVDWGDGTTGAYTSNQIAVKRYDQTTYAGLTSSVFRNYKTLIIKVTPQTGQNLTTISLAPQAISGSTVSNGVTGFGTFVTNGWLDIRMAGSSVTSLSVSTWSGSGRSSKMLEQFEYVGNAALTSFSLINCESLVEILSFPSTANVSNWQSVFYGCKALQEIPRTALDGLVVGRVSGAAYYTFYQCYSLPSLPINAIDCRNVTTGLEGFFNGCANLRRSPQFLNTSNVTNMAAMFAECGSLEEAPFLDSTKNTNFSYLFFLCRVLKKVQDSFAGASGITFSNMFQGCISLKTLPYINTVNGHNFIDFARDCFSLQTIPAYDYTNSKNLTRLCFQASNLKYVPDINSGLTLTNLNSAFYACSNLIEAPGITATNVTNITDLYNACIGLKTIPAYNFQKATTTTTPFPRSGSLQSFGATGISFSFSLASNALGSTALNSIYNNLVTVGASGAGSRTLTVSGNWGFTASDRTIAIGKGWAIA